MSILEVKHRKSKLNRRKLVFIYTVFIYVFYLHWRTIARVMWKSKEAIKYLPFIPYVTSVQNASSIQAIYSIDFQQNNMHTKYVFDLRCNNSRRSHDASFRGACLQWIYILHSFGYRIQKKKKTGDGNEKNTICMTME